MDAELAGHVGHLALGLVGFHAAELVPGAGGSRQGLPVVILADRHSGGGGTDDEGHFPAGETRIDQGLAGGHPGEAGASVHTRPCLAGNPGEGSCFRQIDLASGADALTGNIEESDRPEGHAAGSEGGGVFRPIQAHRGDDASPAHDHRER